jgi:hypothetical protein
MFFNKLICIENDIDIEENITLIYLMANNVEIVDSQFLDGQRFMTLSGSIADTQVVQLENILQELSGCE